jgi:hypothetical protein
MGLNSFRLPGRDVGIRQAVNKKDREAAPHDRRFRRSTRYVYAPCYLAVEKGKFDRWPKNDFAQPHSRMEKLSYPDIGNLPKAGKSRFRNYGTEPILLLQSLQKSCRSERLTQSKHAVWIASFAIIAICFGNSDLEMFW